MDTFEKEQAKKQLEVLKSINRNINFLGRKLEMTNNILGKYGIAILPGAEAVKEEATDKNEAVVKIGDIKAWVDQFCESRSIDRQMTSEASLVATAFNMLFEDLENDGKLIQ